MPAMGPDSILLGFMPNYLHMTISSPRYISATTRDFFLCATYKFLRFLKEEAPKTEGVIIDTIFFFVQKSYAYLPCP